MATRLTIEMVSSFWERNYQIIEAHTPMNELIEESEIINLLKERYPHLRYQHNILKSIFTTISTNLNIGLRRIKRRYSYQSYYNVKLKDNKQIELNLLNTQGLITRSGNNKSRFIYDLTSHTNCETILALTETHLTSGHLDEEILSHFKDYTLLRADRDTMIGRKSRGGGVLILTSPNIVCTNKISFSNGCCELKIALLDQLNISIVLIYRPPDTEFNEFLQILRKVDAYLTEHKTDTTILLGDFNFPSSIVEWQRTEDGIIAFPTNERGSPAKLQFQELQSLTNKYYLQQTVAEKTTHHNILDLIYTDSPNLLHSLSIIPTKSDHHLVHFHTDIYQGTYNQDSETPFENVPTFSKYNFDRANKVLLAQKLRESNLVDIVTNAATVPEAKKQLVDQYIVCARLANVPMKRKSQPITNPQVHSLRKKRRKLQNKINPAAQEAINAQIKAGIQSINDQLDTIYHNDRIRKETNYVGKIKTDPRVFYKIANKSRKIKTKIGPLKKLDSNGQATFVKDPKGMANILSDQYKSVFTEPSNPPQETETQPPPNVLEDVTITAESVTVAIKSINSNSAPGPDGVTPKFLRDYVEILAEPIAVLNRRSIDTGSPLGPNGINFGHITPIYKGGKKCDAPSYRPVTLTDHDTKIIEKDIKAAIVTFLNDNHKFNETQHGFRTKRSTFTNLIEYFESILLQLQIHQSVDAIYLDFSKAFDKCDHKIILHKLYKLGIRGKVLKWIENFLTMRKQRVFVDQAKSDEVSVKSGVPQGSVLGPLLFIVLMHDITSGIFQSILSSFADDTKIWKGISMHINEIQLQEDLDIIYRWAVKNNMEFNSKKFQAIRFKLLHDISTYKGPSGEPIEQSQIVKDLGIHLSSNLSFEHHIHIVANRGRQMAGWILRAFTTRDPLLLKTLLKQLIVHLMEYCCILWSPTNQRLITILESVQRNFTSRFCYQGAQLDYWERLHRLKLLSLERRRDRYAILYVWKVLHNLYPNPGLSLNHSFVQQHHDLENQGISFGFHDRLGITASHFIENESPSLNIKSSLTRCCLLYNCLPPELRQPMPQGDDPSKEKFKYLLDKWLERIPDQPKIPSRQRIASSNSIIHQVHYISST